MEEIECTADRAGGDQPNILFTPPCACPRCAPEEIIESDDRHIWLPVQGRRVRFELTDMDLGATGRSLLG